jgi:hypothetical protein
MKFLQKATTFIVLFMNLLFIISIQVKAVAWENTLEGIPIIFSSCNPDTDDNPLVHVELMVLKSDFRADQISDTIREEYRTVYPTYASFSHLETADEISYFAYIQDATMNREDCAYEYARLNDHESQITSVRLIMFNHDGEVLSISQRYVHENPDHFNVIQGFYRADFENPSFSNDRFLRFNYWVIIEWIVLGLLVFLITLVKFGLGIPLRMKYEYPILSWVIDFVIVVIFTSLMYYLYYIPEIRQYWTLLGIVSISWVILFLLDYFLLVKKESRTSLWIHAIVFNILVALLLSSIV